MITLAGLFNLAYAVLPQTAGMAPSLAYFASSVLFLAAAITFALGVFGGGSLVGASRWGRVGLIGLGSSYALLGAVSVVREIVGSPSSSAMVSVVLLVAVGPVCALIAVVSIARAEAIPVPWCLVPMWGMALFTGASIANGQASRLDVDTASVVRVGADLLIAVVWLGYGVIALAIARRTPRSLPA